MCIFVPMKNIFYLFLLFLWACSPSDTTILVTNSGETQGTFYHIKYKSEKGVSYQVQIDSLLAEIDSSVSIYKPYSIISKLNRGEKVQTDDIFNSVYFDAVHVYINTKGYFDCTVFPLVSYWGFYKNLGYDNTEIDSSKVLKILNNIGMHKTSRTDSSVILEKGVHLDFNAIAQGYSVDLIAELLERKGVHNYLIEVGGELKAKGRNADGYIWRVGVDKPSEEIDVNNRFQFILDLENLAMATSGNYRKFEINEETGLRSAHSINPITGEAIPSKVLSASVIAPDCMTADAYATALMVMPIEDSQKLIDSIPELEAYWIVSDSNKGVMELFSSGFPKED